MRGLGYGLTLLMMISVPLLGPPHMAQAQAQRVLRYASAFDPQTMDPHAIALLYHTRIITQVYEGLVNRDEQFRLAPSLALSWQALDARTWRFKLRPGVKFHDGSAFGADDVVFSVERVLQRESQRATQLRGVLGAKKIDALTVDIALAEPDAVLPERFYLIAMMSKAWCEKHGVTRPQDYNAKQETHAVRQAMGTGPFMLKRYESDVSTQLVAHPDWWGRATHRGNLDEVQYQVIQSDATRLAALRSGQVDFVIDPPFQDVGRLRQDPGLKLLETSDIGTQYLAFDQHRAELPGSDVKGRNPFKDLRVRRAIYHAIDMDLIARQVLRGQALPTGAHLSALVDGALPALEPRLPHDPALARRLLAEAGYPQGFSVNFDCVNVSHRQASCQAITAMLKKVGISANFVASPSSVFFPKLTQATGSLIEYGWFPSTDAWNALNSLVRTHDGKTGGAFNAGRYSNPRLDELIDGIATEPDLAQRRQRVGEALRLMQQDLPLLPLYRIKHSWVMKPRVQAVQWPSGVLELRWVRLE
ncbi:ABC transporter substrate-binding protein [Roseateles sp. DAIF2]|uniref:ABC transporter substrate-binding protein n=1 Tax=Roseateles sp. DAIF2 TaxID=2714952 RepID=UPI0018A2593A|nr:ABC transporter substrate-binding protein [Roseateles sp. DAIF2]QPF73032.1 ABC transporter substrate-binding protein [Roseateles sp. DAIF2]